MIKKLLALGMIVVVVSCSDPVTMTSDVDGIKAVDGRLVFKDVESFTNVLHQLEGADSKELMSSLKNLGYVSLKSKLSAALNVESMQTILAQYQDYGLEHQMLLNSDGIVQVGTNVIKYHGNKKYFQDVSLYGTSDITSSPITGDYIVTNYSADGLKNGRAFSTSLNNTPGSGGAQYDYFVLGDGSHRKFVNEWIGILDTFPGGSCGDGQSIVQANAYFKLRLKLEGRPRSSKPWTIAPEPRDLSFSFNINNLVLHYYPSGCFASLTTVPFSPISVTQGTFPEGSGSYSYTVASGTYYMRVPLSYGGYWNGDVTGSVTQTYLNTTPDFTWTDPMI